MAEKSGKTFQRAASLGTLTDVDEVVKNLALILRKTVHVRWILVYFFDRERRTFSPARGYGLSERYMSIFREAPLMPDQVPLLKTMLSRKQHILITDTATSELIPHRYRQLLSRVNLLALPMVVRNQVTGAVFVARHKRFPTFTADDIATIKDIISHAALSVSHMKLYDESLEMALDLARRIDVILTLDEINKSISSSLSREKILDTAMERIDRIIPCTMVAVLQEKDSKFLVTASRWNGEGMPAVLRPGTGVDIGRTVAGSAFRNGKSCSVEALGQKRKTGEIEKEVAKGGISSLLAVPITAQGKSKGVLLLGDRQAGGFVAEEILIIEKIAVQIAVALENARLYEELHTLFISTVTSLANAIDAKSPWTKGHSERVMHSAANIAREMNQSEEMVERVRLGGLLHDVGKIGIIEALLEKPARLSDEEFPPMRLHPEKGVAILAPIEQLHDVLPGILYHHERFDGSGYPKGLKGEGIPLEARIVAVADAFDAMISERPYKNAYPLNQAIIELRRCSGKQFDPKVVEALIHYLERHHGTNPD
ncbi:MAG: HD domain-containing protein [Geobacter sp.]|nr:HD domain-containing protein [Geobacter sp.]